MPLQSGAHLAGVSIPDLEYTIIVTSDDKGTIWTDSTRLNPKTGPIMATQSKTFPASLGIPDLECRENIRFTSRHDVKGGLWTNSHRSNIIHIYTGHTVTFFAPPNLPDFKLHTPH